MEFGAHLPLIGFTRKRFSLRHVIGYARAAQRLGYRFICANDHLVFSRPWLDGPTALAAVLGHTAGMRLATTLSIPVVRGPVQTAKTLAAIDVLSEGRLVVGVGPGSSPKDYGAVGIRFEERWKRLDEAVKTLRALFSRNSEPFRGSFYDTEGIELEPYPAQQPRPPIWIGSWGSKAGLRRTARLGDGWLASGYNTTPAAFASAWDLLRQTLGDMGKDPDEFPNAIATMFFYVTESRAKAEGMIRDVLSPALNRSPDELSARLPIGPAEECAEKLARYEDAGAQRVFMWPIDDDIEQLDIFWDRVVPLLPEHRSAR